MLVAAGCSSDSENDSAPTTVTTPDSPDLIETSSPPPDPSVGDATEPEAACPTKAAPQNGGCAVVDWDPTAIDGSTIMIQAYLNSPGCAETINRVDVHETESRVRLTAVANYQSDQETTCPTALGSTDVTVELSAPLAQRFLVGCRPPSSFAPAGGYNTPAPREDNADCIRAR